MFDLNDYVACWFAFTTSAAFINPFVSPLQWRLASRIGSGRLEIC
jgi:hypothetical protein